MRTFSSILLLLLFSCMCLFFNGCKEKGSEGNQAPSRAQKSNKKPLIVGTCAEFPPFEFCGADGTYNGIDIDIMEHIAEKLGMELVVENMDFDLIIPKIQSGELMVGAAGMTINEKRKELVDFTQEYYSGSQVILVTNNSSVKSKDDLYGKVIAVQSGTTGEALAKEMQLDTVSSPRASDAVLAILHNSADAAILDDEPARSFQTRNSIRLKVLPEKLTEESYGLAVSKQNSQLLNSIDRALDEMKKNGELKAIFDQWMHE